MEFPMAFLELTCLLMFITVSYALVRDNNHLELNRSSFPEKFIFGTASSAYQTEGAASEAGRGPSMCDTFTHKHPVSYALVRDNNHLELNRGSFPERFIFGTASSAYQTEGAASEDGRGPSICDTFTHKHPERIADGSNGDVAIDSYHRFKGDVNIMKNMSLDAYRFSISWSRILPNGSLSGGINWEGINHYNKFIDELISNGLQPFVTLFHFDTPQGLEDKYGSFLSSNIVEDFRDYAGICFSKFGDRVKHWITFNEISSFSIGGFNFRDNPDVDLGRAPYIVGHNQLLAHAAAVKLYRDRFKPRQQGKIGTTIATKWMVPYSNTKSDINAVERALDFMFGWVMNPLTRGNYPFNMRRLVGSRLPKFTAEQSKMLRGSFDFIGLNYYTASYVHSLPVYNGTNKTYFTDMCINQTALRHGIPIGPLVGSSWIYNYPKGIRDLLLYTKGKYNNPVIYITENGVDEVNNGTLSLEESLEDDMRIDFHNQHLYHVQSAIRLVVVVETNPQAPCDNP